MGILALKKSKELIFDEGDRYLVEAYPWILWENRGVIYARANLPRVNGKRQSLVFHRALLGVNPTQRGRSRGDKYCSQSCAASSRNKGIDRWLKKRGAPLMHACHQCGTETKNKKFCSYSCSAMFHHGLKRGANSGVRDCVRTAEERRRLKIEAWQRYKARKVSQTPPDVDVKELQRIYLACLSA
jgi:hypothetical protein